MYKIIYLVKYDNLTIFDNEYLAIFRKFYNVFVTPLWVPSTLF